MGAFEVDRSTLTMSMNQTPEEVMANVNAIARACAEEGIKCLYHNHDFEFRADANGIVPIDYFLENPDPEVLNFQMDLFWVNKARVDPLAYFEGYPGCPRAVGHGVLPGRAGHDLQRDAPGSHRDQSRGARRNWLLVSLPPLQGDGRGRGCSTLMTNRRHALRLPALTRTTI